MIAIGHSIYSQSVHAPARDAGLMDNDAERYCSWFVKDVIKKFSGQVYIDFALAYSVLHFNYGKSRHAGLFSHMELNVEIYSQMYYLANDTRRSCVSAKKNTEKNKKLDNRKGYKKKEQGEQWKIVGGVCP